MRVKLEDVFFSAAGIIRSGLDVRRFQQARIGLVRQRIITELHVGAHTTATNSSVIPNQLDRGNPLIPALYP